MNIFERYGIKEVANVYFEALERADDGSGIEKGDIVLYLDTLKVSTIETTAENVSAQGGWGNPKLVTWDYGKDINVTLEDAVISWEEMRILMGTQMNKASDETTKVTLRKNAEYKHEAEKNDEDGYDPVTTLTIVKNVDGKTDKGEFHWPAKNGLAKKIRYIDMTNGTRGQLKDEAFEVTEAGEGTTAKLVITVPELQPDENGILRVRFFWEEDAAEAGVTEATELVISPDRYPGTYRVVGDSLIRSEKTGNDEAFQFVINKAKMLSEVTLTMQAEGDPSTFNMTLNVLRDEDGNMMSLVKY